MKPVNLGYKFGDLLGCFGMRYCGVMGCGVINLDVAEILLNQVSKRSSVVLSKFRHFVTARQM